MDEKNKHRVTERIAQIASDLFSPIILPSYMMAVAMWFTPLVILPEKVRLLVTGLVVALTALIPTAVIFTLIKLGRAKDVSLSSRSERTIPYLVSIVCYLVTAFSLFRMMAPSWLCAFFVGASIASTAATVITLKWKISAHGSAVGGFAAAVIWLASHGLILAGAMWWVSGAVVLCGLVGSSRLILDRHTPAQVYAGIALGAAAVTGSLVMSVLYN